MGHELAKHSVSFVGTGDLISSDYGVCGPRRSRCNPAVLELERPDVPLGSPELCPHYPPSICALLFKKMTTLFSSFSHIKKAHVKHLHCSWHETLPTVNNWFI